MRTRFFISNLLVLSLVIGLSCVAYAGWVNDPYANKPVCQASGKQVTPIAIFDGSSAYIVVWTDPRSGSDYLYAQKVNASDGSVAWAANGIQVSNVEVTGNYDLISDGGNGAIVVWIGGPGSDVYAAHILANGTMDTSDSWLANGVVICSAAGVQADVDAIEDLSGGAGIVWEDNRSGTDADIYGHHLLSTGDLDTSGSWVADGLALNNDVDDQLDPILVLGTVNSAIVAWTDYYQASALVEPDIRGCHIFYNGTIDTSDNWNGGSTDFADNISGAQHLKAMVSDGNGGALFFWIDYRDTIYGDIYGHHILSTGAKDTSGGWSGNGVAFVYGTGKQVDDVQAVPDGLGGALINYRELYLATNDDRIYVMHVKNDGNADNSENWISGGNILCSHPEYQTNPRLISDNTGGAISVWQDDRTTVDSDLYAQRILSNGLVGPGAWNYNGGSAVCLAAGDQEDQFIIPDGTNGCVIFWSDGRTGKGTQNDIYCQRITQEGFLNPEIPSMGFWAIILCIILLSGVILYRKKRLA